LDNNLINLMAPRMGASVSRGLSEAGPVGHNLMAPWRGASVSMGLVKRGVRGPQAIPL
jgi:hypothetical protein